MGRKWTLEDDEVLSRLYPYIPNRDLMLLFNRSEGAIQARACSLGLKKDTTKIERDDKRRTHIQTGVFGRIIERQQRAGFLKEV